jgi:hypothetical protein
VATGVVTRGAMAYVAVSGKAENGDWYGQVRAYDALHAYAWSSDQFALSGGRTTQIAVAGGKVFVAGYYGVAGSGDEHVFLRAYDTAGKRGFLWEGSTSAPYAGLYPTGVKALGSKVVAFSNSRIAGQVRGSIAAFTSSTKGNQPRWTADFGDESTVSTQVNDVGISGGRVVAAGSVRDGSGSNWFSLTLYSLAKGSVLESTGRSFGLVGDVNEVLAVAFVGPYLGAAGRITKNGNVMGYFWGLKASKHGLEEVWTDESFEGGETTANTIAMLGTTAYVAGHGTPDGVAQWAFVKAYALAPGTAKHPHGDAWSQSLYSNDPIPTGLAVTKSGVYACGQESSGGVVKWLAWSYDLGGQSKWLQEYSLAGKDINRAAGLAAAGKAVIVVGQCRNAADRLQGVVEALAP